jgi:hypothetical protein
MENKPNTFLEWIHFFEDTEEFPSEEIKQGYLEYKHWDKIVTLKYTEQGWLNVQQCALKLKRLLGLDKTKKE